MAQFNPQMISRAVPQPLVSVGQIQQGYNQQAQNLLNIGKGLENIVRARNAEKIGAMSQGLDFSNPDLVRQQLAPLLGFTTKESRDMINTRIRDAMENQRLRSDIGYKQKLGENIDSQIKDRDAMRPGRVESQELRNEGQRLSNTYAEKSMPDRLKSVGLQNKATEQNIASSKLRDNLSKNQDRRADEQLGLSKEQFELAKDKWNIEKKQFEAVKNKEEALNIMKQNLIRILSDPRIPDAQKRLERQKYEFITGQSTKMFDKQDTPFGKAAGDNIAQKVRNVGPNAVADDFVEKAEAGFNKAAGNILDRPMGGETRKAVKAAIIDMSRDPAYRTLLESGDSEAIYQAVTDYMTQKGIVFDTEYAPELFNPSTWLRPKIKLKEKNN